MSLVFAPHGHQDTSAHRPGDSFFLVTLIQLRRHGVSEISQVPGQPSFASALLSDLGGTSTSGHLTLRCGPRKNNCEDSRGVGTIDCILKNAMIMAKKWEAPTDGCSLGVLAAIGQRS